MHVDEPQDQSSADSRKQKRKPKKKIHLLQRENVQTCTKFHLPQDLIYSYLLRTQKPFSLLTSEISVFIT